MTLGVPVASEIGFRLGCCWKFSLTSRQGYLKQASADQAKLSSHLVKSLGNNIVLQKLDSQSQKYQSRPEDLSLTIQTFTK
jgi:hypothetical protein